jgi:hypothetical protein
MMIRDIRTTQLKDEARIHRGGSIVSDVTALGDIGKCGRIGRSVIRCGRLNVGIGAGEGRRFCDVNWLAFGTVCIV